MRIIGSCELLDSLANGRNWSMMAAKGGKRTFDER
jgi:hypothetical protein